jgi:L-alanine-DL-glutamate epimerase-like enolase superfamily enzyme
LRCAPTISAECWPPKRSTARKSTSPAAAASGRCAPNLHAHVAAAIPNLRHLEYFHDHHRIEHMLFDGALPPDGGALRPDQHWPGLGLDFKHRDAEQYRVR